MTDLPGQTEGEDLYIDDEVLLKTFEQKLTGLLDAGETTDVGVLRRQLNRGRKHIPLLAKPDGEMTFSEVYSRTRGGVLSVGYLYRCTKCTRLHINPATGFVLTASGVIATAYHVMEDPKAEAIGAMTFDGKVFAVKEVIAASKLDDIAVLQLDGDGFQSLPLSREAPVGTPVAMIGHPNRQLYTLTTGVISRYFARRNAGIDVRWMSATAEIGGGASGGPLLDASGAVVGMASKTRSVYTAAHDDEPRNLQMVIRQYVPSSTILSLLTADEGHSQTDQESLKRFVGRVVTLGQRGSWEAIDKEAGVWITDHPHELPLLIGLAGQFMLSQHQEAQRVGEQVLRKIVQEDPGCIDGLKKLASILYNQKRYLEAVEIYRQWLAGEPDSFRVMNDLAWILSEHMAQYTEALSLIEKALKLAPEDPQLLDTYAMLCFHLGRHDEAEANFRKVIELEELQGTATPISVVSRLHLADVYWDTDRTADAGRLYSECLDLNKTARGLKPGQVAKAERRCWDLAPPSK